MAGTVFATVWGPRWPHGETAKKTGPDRTTIFTQSRPWTFKDCSLEGGPRAPQGETLLCRPNKRTIGDGGGLRSPDQDGRDLWGSAGICLAAYSERF